MRRSKFSRAVVHRVYRAKHGKFLPSSRFEVSVVPRSHGQVCRRAWLMPLIRFVWHHIPWDLLSSFPHGAAKDTKGDRAQQYRYRTNAYPDYDTSR
jgi:hypothetical protein